MTNQPQNNDDTMKVIATKTFSIIDKHRFVKTEQLNVTIILDSLSYQFDHTVYSFRSILMWIESVR